MSQIIHVTLPTSILFTNNSQRFIRRAFDALRIFAVCRRLTAPLLKCEIHKVFTIKLLTNRHIQSII